ncbi:MAG: hypothetical protein A2516_01625 [Alphaproteobacteria bacterium RIFOXYD12_FULL_60_8]|nr:MAG: hypothetical protein A2516_01625 [Alphaproteobacteria bacterium RIFOXYD12_FULL_60_8]
MDRPIPAFAFSLFWGVLVWVFLATVCFGQEPPAAAKPLLPILAEEIAARWPDAPDRPAFGAQVEQETCPSLISKKCWNPRTELKTSREYGFGLGQLTVTSRFNAWEETKAMDAGLRSWKWEDRYDPRLQLRALVVKDRYNFERFPPGPERMAFALAAYNGGLGGTIKDMKMCAASPPCNPNLWFGHVERTSYKAKIKVKGYGKSFFDINREYVGNTLRVRHPRYVSFLGV